MKKNFSSWAVGFAAWMGLMGSMSISAFSAEVAPDAPAQTSNVSSDDRNHDESWYWGFNLGGGRMKYTKASLEASAETLRNTSGVDHGTYYFDLYFLWPLASRQTALGVSLGGVDDNYSVGVPDEELDIMTSLLAFSAHHYFSGNIGDGFFARGDIGLASLRAKARVGNTRSTSDSYSGVGLRLGVGYSIILSNETRLPISLQWQHAKVENENGSNALTFSVGLLF